MHEYRVEITVEREALDEHGMVCNLDLLNGALDDLVSRLDGQDLDAIVPSEAGAVTVEVFARWVHAELEEPVRSAGGETLAVRVWESADAFGGYRAELDRA